MIRKCNTHSKTSSTPFSQIRVSQFLQNQDPQSQSISHDYAANEEINFNIIKIKECKKQAEQFIYEMNSKIGIQNMALQHLQDNFLLERQKAKNFRLKYHEAMLELRKKEEEKESLERKLKDSYERCNFLTSESQIQMKDWVSREQQYLEKIRELEKIVLESKVYPHVSFKEETSKNDSTLRIEDCSMLKEESTFT